MRRLAAAALFACSCACVAQERTNVLNMATGAVVLSRSEYNDSQWSAFNLFDDDPKSIWCSPDNKTRGNEIVIELASRHRLETLVLDNTGVQEGKYAGVSARNVELWISSSGPQGEYRKAAAFEAPKGGRKEFALPAGLSAEWLKLVIADNWGSNQYTELGEVQIFGAAEAAARRGAIPGIYQTNYGPLQLWQDGNRVTGCWAGGQGRVNGFTDGRVVQLEWRRSEQKKGAALMVLTTQGDVLNGLWYEGGRLAGTWSGKRDAKARNECPDRDDSLAAQLQKDKRAIAYGIHFKSNSDALELESETVLKQILAALRSSPAMKLRVEGHTDSTNTDAYNLDLSRRRAAAVVKWLTSQGVEPARLSADGFGKSRPVADNATPQGRALNRRVELAAS